MISTEEILELDADTLGIKCVNKYQERLKISLMRGVAYIKDADTKIMFLNGCEKDTIIDKQTKIYVSIQSKIRILNEWNSLDTKIHKKCEKIIRRATIYGIGGGIFSRFLYQFLKTGALSLVQVDICLRAISISYNKRARSSYLNNSWFWFLEENTYVSGHINSRDTYCDEEFITVHGTKIPTCIRKTKKIIAKVTSIAEANPSNTPGKILKNTRIKISGSGRMTGVFSGSPKYKIEKYNLEEMIQVPGSSK